MLWQNPKRFRWPGVRGDYGLAVLLKICCLPCNRIIWRASFVSFFISSAFFCGSICRRCAVFVLVSSPPFVCIGRGNKKVKLWPETLCQVFADHGYLPPLCPAQLGFVGQPFAGFIWPGIETEAGVGATLIKRVELNASFARKVSIRALSRLHPPQKNTYPLHPTSNTRGRQKVECNCYAWNSFEYSARKCVHLNWILWNCCESKQQKKCRAIEGEEAESGLKSTLFILKIKQVKSPVVQIWIYSFTNIFSKPCETLYHIWTD